MRGIVLAGWIAALAGMAGSGLASADPYAPLALYNGHWQATAADGKVTQIDNTCSRIGAFFACQQTVDHKPGALLVFLPVGSRDGVSTYRSAALPVSGAAAGRWGQLTIQGSRWTYSADPAAKEIPPYGRVLNVFSGRDAIHYEIQTSSDGKTWEKVNSGDEKRLP